MEEVLQDVGVILQQAGVIFANGWLTIAYFFLERLALLVSLLSLPAILLAESRILRQLLGRPFRGGGRADPSASSGQAPSTLLRAGIPLRYRGQQLITLGIGVLWIATCLRTPPPVPQIGAAMWGVTAVYFLRSRQASEIGWRLKGFLALYALAAPALELLLRLNLFYSSPYQWARFLDLPVEATAASTEQFNAIILQIALTLMRYGIPFAFAWYVLQRIGVHVPGWFAPGQSREEAARRLRYRD
jgi:hypothetical protein